MKYTDASDIFTEITKAVPSYGKLNYSQIPKGGLKLSTYDNDSTFIFPQWLERMAQSGVRRNK